jgi:hypothetical protein
MNVLKRFKFLTKLLGIGVLRQQLANPQANPFGRPT